MGYNQQAFYAESAALARALEIAARRRSPPAKVTIFTDAQAAIWRMASQEPGPGQKYAIQARKWIKVLREVRCNGTEPGWAPGSEMERVHERSGERVEGQGHGHGGRTADKDKDTASGQPTRTRTRRADGRQGQGHGHGGRTADKDRGREWGARGERELIL